jgi:thiol:disulfide interchange protein
VLLSIALVAVVPLTSQESTSEKNEYPPVSKFDAARDTAKDIQDGVMEAKRTGKRVLLDVGGEWCIWCKWLDQMFEENRDIAEFLHQNFVVVKVNYSKENKNEVVLSRYPKVAGYPHLFVLENDGTLLHSQDSGKLEKGKGHDREKVFAFLKTWAPKK